MKLKKSLAEMIQWERVCRVATAGKGGIVKDPAQHQRVIEEVNSAAERLGLRVVDVIESPIHGAEGNVEFLALYESSRD
jgi:23S rRNA (cytidine1920-2'-O)/16S rRNA (cytidine1409-2'-O)-methyltransferase